MSRVEQRILLDGGKSSEYFSGDSGVYYNFRLDQFWTLDRAELLQNETDFKLVNTYWLGKGNDFFEKTLLDGSNKELIYMGEL